MVKYVFIAIFLSVFIVTGVLLSFFGFKYYSYGMEAKKWPTVQGEVIETSITEVYHDDSSGPSYYTYHPVMTYTYSVNGGTYNITEQLAGYDEEDEAEIYTESHEPGTKQIVYYNPEMPEKALTDPDGEAVGGIIMMAIGIIFIIVSSIIGFVFWVNRN